MVSAHSPACPQNWGRAVVCSRDTASGWARLPWAPCTAQPIEGAETAALTCGGRRSHYDWLVDQGVPFKQTYYPGVSGEPPTDDALVWSGSERSHPFAEAIA